MEYSNKIEKKAECLNRIIDHLNLLKQNEYQLAQIEKDIILQDLREAYVNILSMEVTPLVEEIVQEEMVEEILVTEPAVEEVEEEEVEEIQEEVAEEEEEMTQVVEEILAERVSEEEEAAEMAMEEEPDVYVEECVKEEIEEDIREEVTEEIVEEEAVEENIIEEEVIEEDIIEEQVTELPSNKPENLEIENDLDFLTEKPKPEVQQEKQEEPIKDNRVPDLFAELEMTQTFTNDDLEDDNTSDDFGVDMEADDISHFLGNEPKMPTSSQSIEIEPVVEEEEEEVVAMEPPIITPDLSTPPQETTVNTKIEEPVQPEKPAVRSLNDLLNESKEDKSLNTKFQNVKVTDLTKLISINDKFLFIRELFKNRGEEFSTAIQTFNNCQNIDDAFNYMETLKKKYYWDSTSPAYLTFCDLIRRKF